MMIVPTGRNPVGKKKKRRDLIKNGYELERLSDWRGKQAVGCSVGEGRSKDERKRRGGLQRAVYHDVLPV